MTGFVDDSGRSLVRLRINHPTITNEMEIEAWIDTGFTGELLVPKAVLDSLGLPLGPAVKARLADGACCWTTICTSDFQHDRS
jgi:clan AA aspartic protease